MARDLRDRTIVITGGSSGIGAAAARILAGAGARVVITGRSAQTQEHARKIGADPYLVDYTSFADVERFAKKLVERHPRIDLLVNNVGSIIGERRVTGDGHEMTLQVNHLSGFHLTNLLRPQLEASGAVVINTASRTHRYGAIDFDDIQAERSYNALLRYSSTKLMNILHAKEIERRFSGVAAVSFHPGGVATGFAREGRGMIRWIYQTPLRRLFLTSPEKGADTLVWLAQGLPGEDWEPGGYYEKRRPGRLSAHVDPATARKLWEASEALVAGPRGGA